MTEGKETKLTKYIILEDLAGNGDTWTIKGSISANGHERALREFVGDKTGAFAAVAESAFHAQTAAKRTATRWTNIELPGISPAPTSPRVPVLD